MNSKALKGRSLLTWINFTPEEIRSFLDLTRKVKAESRKPSRKQRFKGKTLALIFEKRSTRTRAAFETAFGEEGGHPVFLSSQDIQLGAKESIEDTARVLGRMFSAIEFRGFRQADAEVLAKYAGVPVYNGLTDSFHPTQALADFFTLEEIFGSFKGKKLAFVGDGRNNVARSLMVICSKMGADFTIIAPRQLWPDPELRDLCKGFALESGSQLAITDQPEAGVRGASALYTDVWTSMGEEALEAERAALLSPYQVNAALMAATGEPSCVFLHCLPAVKGKEVTFDVFEGTQSRVFDQAENRKHANKAILLATL
jgi:ornithine carbamoyltransferase